MTIQNFTQAYLNGLRTVRQALDLDVEGLAAKSGVHANSIYRLERCEQSPALKTCSLLATALCCETVDLQERPDERRLLEIVVRYRERELEKAKTILLDQEDIAS